MYSANSFGCQTKHSSTLQRPQLKILSTFVLQSPNNDGKSLKISPEAWRLFGNDKRNGILRRTFLCDLTQHRFPIKCRMSRLSCLELNYEHILVLKQIRLFEEKTGYWSVITQYVIWDYEIINYTNIDIRCLWRICVFAKISETKKENVFRFHPKSAHSYSTLNCVDSD